MATITLSSLQAAGYDMWVNDATALITIAGSYTPSSNTPTQVIYNGGAFRLTLDGTFTAFNGHGDPAQGTVTTLTLRYSSGGITNTMTITNIALDAATLFGLIDSGNEAGLHTLIFGGDDTLTGGGANELFQGHGGDDTIDGGDGNDTLYGDNHPSVPGAPAGNDTLNGGNGNDTIDGGAGDDIMNGGAGQDTIIAAAGVDTIDGGDDIDRLTLDRSSSASPISFNLSTFQATGTFYDGTTVTNVEIVTFKTGAGEDTLNITAGFNGEVIYDGGAGAGDHIIVDNSTGAGRLNISLDRITVSDTSLLRISNVARITATGGALNDSFQGRAGNDWMHGGGGTDSISGNDGDDTIFGGDANDTLNGNNGVDTIDGGLANDTINGGAGNDILFGGDGVDTINGGTGTDTIDAGEGNDNVHYFDIDGADQVTGGNGTDTLHLNLTGMTQSVTLSIAMATQPGGLVLSTGATFQSFERWGNLTFGSGADTLNLAPNNFGGGGATVNGGAGFDRLVGDYSSQSGALTFVNGTLNNIVVFTAFEQFVLTGGSGADTLEGGAFNDTLIANAGLDNLNGGAGDDWLDGGAGADVINGGDGVDVVAFGGSSAVTADLASGVFTGGFAAGDTITNVEGVSGTGGADQLFGDANANKLIGQNGNDFLQGRGGIDNLQGGGHNDWLDGGAGADILNGGDGIDTAAFGASLAAVTADLASGVLSGGDATGDTLINIENLSGSWWGDTFYGDANINILSGQNGNDILQGRGGIDTLNGGAGNDWLDGGADGDIINGGDGVDTAAFGSSLAAVTADLQSNTLSGGDATGDTLVSIENLSGGWWSDTFYGNAGANTLHGQNGNDILQGRGGIDTLNGGAGNDWLDGGAGGDIINGGDGLDTAAFGASTSAVVVDLSFNDVSGGDAAGDTLISIENLSGSGHGDTLIGDAGANRLNGQGGNDYLSGGGGLDTLIGGAGADDFVFIATPESGIVTITDFVVGLDRIGLDQGSFSVGNTDLTASEFHIGAAATDAAHRIIYDDTTGALYFDADGNGAGAAVQFATLTAGLTLTNDDFFIIP